jgi:hypothetical protein
VLLAVTRNTSGNDIRNGMCSTFGDWSDMILAKNPCLCTAIGAAVIISGFNFLPLSNRQVALIAKPSCSSSIVSRLNLIWIISLPLQAFCKYLFPVCLISRLLGRLVLCFVLSSIFSVYGFDPLRMSEFIKACFFFDRCFVPLHITFLSFLGSLWISFIPFASLTDVFFPMLLMVETCSSHSAGFAIVGSTVKCSPISVKISEWFTLPAFATLFGDTVHAF